MQTRSELKSQDHIYAWIKGSKSNWVTFGGLVQHKDLSNHQDYYIFCCFRDGIFHYVED